jgi:glycosyltransferase involved in cell wall biosynthesis
MLQKSPNQSGIAILLPCLLTGGTEVATLQTALALESLGFSAEVIVYFDEVDSTMLASFRAMGLVVHLLGARRGSGFLSHLRLASGLQRVLRCGQFDVIWVQYMTPTLMPLFVARLHARRLIAAVHVAASHYSPKGLQRLRWLARNICHHVVCVSHTVATGIFGPDDSAARASGRVVVLPNALDLRTVQSVCPLNWRDQMGWPADTVVLGFAGRLTHFKGVDVLLHAAARLHALGMPVRLVVAGDGADASDLRTLAQQLGICAITHFTGRLPREAIFSAIRGFDIAVMPSRGGLEGFGLSALEAMAAGVPVVVSRVDALQEVVLDGVTGLLCPAEDSAALADGLARLVSDARLRHAMGAEGVAHVARLYDTPVYRANLRELLAVLGLPIAEAA